MHVGGDTEAAIQRAVRIADGYFPGEGDAERLDALLGRLRTAAEKAGRDPASIEINAIFGAQMMPIPFAASSRWQNLGWAASWCQPSFSQAPVAWTD